LSVVAAGSASSGVLPPGAVPSPAWDVEGAVPVVDGVPQVKRRRLQRRHTEEQVKRLVKVNLEPKFGKQVLAKVGKSGVGMFEYMCDVLRDLKGSDAYWTSANWVALYSEFGLQVSLEDKLEDPPLTDGCPSEALTYALSVAHSPNPADRSSEKVERFLENCEALNQTEVYGMLIACSESPVISKALHAKLFVAIAKFFARTFVLIIVTAGVHGHQPLTFNISFRFVKRPVFCSMQSTFHAVLVHFCCFAFSCFILEALSCLNIRYGLQFRMLNKRCVQLNLCIE
jgi:hypothetical protein